MSSYFIFMIKHPSGSLNCSSYTAQAHPVTQGCCHPLRQLVIDGVNSPVEIPSPLVWLGLCQVDKSYYDIILEKYEKHSHPTKAILTKSRMYFLDFYILISFYELGITGK